MMESTDRFAAALPTSAAMLWPIGRRRSSLPKMPLSAWPISGSCEGASNSCLACGRFAFWGCRMMESTDRFAAALPTSAAMLWPIGRRRSSLPKMPPSAWPVSGSREGAGNSCLACGCLTTEATDRFASALHTLAAMVRSPGRGRLGKDCDFMDILKSVLVSPLCGFPNEDRCVVLMPPLVAQLPGAKVNLKELDALLREWAPPTG
mmetsp:Transcript_95764/g.205465  ORF Transcript_95764/g.205465 Transcript_95764/m.205465 type:complete len:206 (+) Transcript_95764:108-725(+)